MSFCPSCSIVEPIEDTGAIVLHSEHAEHTEKLLSFLAQQRIAYDIVNDMYLLPYDTKEILLSTLHALKQTFGAAEEAALKFAVQSRTGTRAPLHEPPLSTLSQFLSMLQNQDLVSIIREAQFTSHMQPIIDIRNRQMFAYEFLLRPAADRAPFKPYELFRTAQETGLHSFLDRQARISAIETSARHLPNGIKRFINFLPSSIYNPNYCLSHTFHAIERLQLSPGDFVFEVVETERIIDIKHLQAIFQVYKKEGMQVALDDVGAGFATLEVLEQLQPDYVKVDRDLISNCDQDTAKQDKLTHIMKVSQSIGAKVLGEGIERAEELAFLASIGVHYAQGYLIGKPSAQPLPPSAE